MPDLQWCEQVQNLACCVASYLGPSPVYPNTGNSFMDAGESPEHLRVKLTYTRSKINLHKVQKTYTWAIPYMSH